MSLDLSKVAYISMSGAEAQGKRLHTIAENLSNLQSIGYRAQITEFTEKKQAHTPFSSVSISNQHSNFKTGALKETGNTLDLAIENHNGFFMVLAEDGSEGLTRNGALRIDENGQLKTLDGKPVLGAGGPIAIPPNSKVSINSDGTITATDINSPALTQTVGKIRLVSISKLSDLLRGDDGLFRLKTGESPQVDPNVVVRQGFVEESNVNPPHELTEMISNSRVFEYQMRVIHEINQTQQAANQLLSMSHS